MDYLKQVLPLHAFEGFLYGSIFDKVVFCIEKITFKKDKCNSRYNRVGNFSVSLGLEKSSFVC